MQVVTKPVLLTIYGVSKQGFPNIGKIKNVTLINQYLQNTR